MRVHRYVRGADVVHSHDRRSGLWVRLGPTARAARAHAARPAGPVPRLARAGARGSPTAVSSAACPTDVLVAPSHAAARLLQARVGYTREITVVPNGVDVPTSRSTRGDAGRHAVRARAGEGARRVPRRRAARARAAAGDALRDLRHRLARGGAARARARVCRSRSRATCRAAEALRELAVLALPSHMETSGIALLRGDGGGRAGGRDARRRDRGDGAGGRRDARSRPATRRRWPPRSSTCSTTPTSPSARARGPPPPRTARRADRGADARALRGRAQPPAVTDEPGSAEAARSPAERRAARAILTRRRAAAPRRGATAACDAEAVACGASVSAQLHRAPAADPHRALRDDGPAALELHRSAAAAAGAAGDRDA